MSKRAYKTHLRSGNWAQVKTAALNRDEGRCTICQTSANLEHHHATYTVKGRSILGYELSFLYAIITVCEKCHKAIHSDRNHVLNPYNINRKYR